MARKAKAKNTLVWLYEPLLDDPRFEQRRLFSFQAAYLDGRLYLAVADGKEPWNGLLVCTSKDRQAELREDCPQLVSHKVLGKWLYLSQSAANFETLAQELVAMAQRRDARLGVEPQSRNSPKDRSGTKRKGNSSKGIQE
jgi:hypothetical protein